LLWLLALALAAGSGCCGGRPLPVPRSTPGRSARTLPRPDRH